MDSKTNIQALSKTNIKHQSDYRGPRSLLRSVGRWVIVDFLLCLVRALLMDNDRTRLGINREKAGNSSSGLPSLVLHIGEKGRPAEEASRQIEW